MLKDMTKGNGPEIPGVILKPDLLVYSSVILDFSFRNSSWNCHHTCNSKRILWFILPDSHDIFDSISCLFIRKALLNSSLVFSSVFSTMMTRSTSFTKVDDDGYDYGVCLCFACVSWFLAYPQMASNNVILAWDRWQKDRKHNIGSSLSLTTQNVLESQEEEEEPLNRQQSFPRMLWRDSDDDALDSLFIHIHFPFFPMCSSYSRKRHEIWVLRTDTRKVTLASLLESLLCHWHRKSSQRTFDFILHAKIFHTHHLLTFFLNLASDFFLSFKSEAFWSYSCFVTKTENVLVSFSLTLDFCYTIFVGIFLL